MGADAIALAAAAAQPWVDMVLSGVASVEQLRANLLAADLHLGDTELDHLAGLAKEPEQYWKQRAQFIWD